MTHDQARATLRTEIGELRKARDAMPDGDEKKATTAQIEQLLNEVDRLDVTAADQLGARIDAIVEKIEEVIEAENLDAASALWRSASRLRELI